MDCPRCNTELRVETQKGIEVDRCPNCQGLWLDYPELDHLEDGVMAEDQRKGTLVYSPHSSEMSCPKCHQQMTVFYYRANRLKLDLCGHGHGFWMDHGEDKLVLGFMRQRIKDLKRTTSAEVQWGRFLDGSRSKSFFQRVKDLFRGR